jgi:hypothetical protein
MNIPFRPTHWIVKEPFPGWAQSYLGPDGTVAYSSALTAAEYIARKAEHGDTMRLITDAEFDALLNAHEAALVTKPAPITADRFDDWLGCLPPCRWHRHAGVELFHVSERLTGDLVQWCARIEGQCYGWTDQAKRPSDELAAAVAEAHRIHTGPGAN